MSTVVEIDLVVVDGWGEGAEDARELCVAIIATPLSS